ncbi:MAG: hypothetical protein DRR19_20480 [Candidatus Parabeggiatoa sp. nov. 1]|nr:MAG: hypothetical protein DRR19_20480 [Gammaproteobacteria bacterium]
MFRDGGQAGFDIVVFFEFRVPAWDGLQIQLFGENKWKTWLKFNTPVPMSIYIPNFVGKSTNYL